MCSNDIGLPYTISDCTVAGDTPEDTMRLQILDPEVTDWRVTLQKPVPSESRFPRSHDSLAPFLLASILPRPATDT